MNETTMRKKESVPRSWEDIVPDEHPIEEWKKQAFQAALEKLQTEHGDPHAVMRMGEAFGRGLFAQQIKEKSPEWTVREWLEEIQKNVCTPLGTEFTFTNISKDVATTFIKRNPLMKSSQERTASSLFQFGIMRGLFLSAFPKGELLINLMGHQDQPEFIFKEYASAKDKLERAQVIRALTLSKNDDGA